MKRFISAISLTFAVSLAVAAPQKLVIVGDSVILTSEDQGATWAPVKAVPSGLRFSNLTYANHRYLAVTLDGYDAVSDDAVHWSVHAFPFSAGYLLNAITWANNQYIMTYTSGVATSIDGTTWTPHFLQPLGGGDILWDGKQFIICYAAIYTSPDGANWTVRHRQNQFNLVSIAWNQHNRYIVAAVNFAGTNFLTSADGRHWSSHPRATSADITSVAWGNHIFVAVGFNGMILTSPDGSVWTQQESGVASNLQKVSWVDGQFIAVGGDVSGRQESPILTSRDGVHWRVRRSGVYGLLDGVG